jgi:hypothetical protein
VVQRVGGLLQRGVEPAQRGRHREVHEREVRQGHDQDGTGETLDARCQRYPAVAVDERGNSERGHQQKVPDTAERYPGALHQPCASEAQHDAQGDPGYDEADGVEQQLPHPGTKQQLAGLVRPTVTV